MGPSAGSVAMLSLTARRNVPGWAGDSGAGQSQKTRVWFWRAGEREKRNWLTFVYKLVQAASLRANKKQGAAPMAGEAQAGQPAMEGHVGAR